MTAILRLALAYFSALPLQRWTGGISAVLIVLALWARFMSADGATSGLSPTLLMLGGILLVLAPLMAGGGMMRATSSRMILHLRPWGRPRMLLAATLAVTLVAATITLMLLLAAHSGSGSMRPKPFSQTPPLQVFALAWSGVAMIWLGVFIVSGNRLLAMLIGFLPLTLANIGVRPPSLGSMPDASVVVVLGVVMWTIFSVWYLRAPSIRQLISSRTRQKEFYDNPVTRFLQRNTGASGRVSRAVAINQNLLGMPSPLGHLRIGVVVTIFAALMLLMFRNLFRDGRAGAAFTQFLVPFVFVMVSMISWTVFGFFMARRARLLWLRAGLDRSALFRQIERTSLLSSALGFGSVLIVALVFSIINWPARTDTIMMFFAVQIAFTACLFYGGLSLTRGWAAQDVLLAMGLCALLGSEIMLLRPWSEERNTIAPFLLGALVALAPVLRWHAQRNWLSLDWRVAQLPRMMRGMVA